MDHSSPAVHLLPFTMAVGKQQKAQCGSGVNQSKKKRLNDGRTNNGHDNDACDDDGSDDDSRRCWS